MEAWRAGCSHPGSWRTCSSRSRQIETETGLWVSSGCSRLLKTHSACVPEGMPCVSFGRQIRSVGEVTGGLLSAGLGPWQLHRSSAGN